MDSYTTFQSEEGHFAKTSTSTAKDTVPLLGENKRQIGLSNIFTISILLTNIESKQGSFENARTSEVTIVHTARNLPAIASSCFPS
jgi:hypothetical protein